MTIAVMMTSPLAIFCQWAILQQVQAVAEDTDDQRANHRAPTVPTSPDRRVPPMTTEAVDVAMDIARMPTPERARRSFRDFRTLLKKYFE